MVRSIRNRAVIGPDSVLGSCVGLAATRVFCNPLIFFVEGGWHAFSQNAADMAQYCDSLQKPTVDRFMNVDTHPGITDPLMSCIEVDDNI